MYYAQGLAADARRGREMMTTNKNHLRRVNSLGLDNFQSGVEPISLQQIRLAARARQNPLRDAPRSTSVQVYSPSFGSITFPLVEVRTTRLISGLTIIVMRRNVGRNRFE